jgi:hypothetical protein
MRSNPLATRPRLRRALPWGLWGLAGIVGIPLALSYTGFGSSPAVIESRVANLAPIRTAHRLRITKVLVSPGQKVKKDDLLVQMDTAAIDADIAVAQAELAYVEILAGWKQVLLINDRARTSHDLAYAAERASSEAARMIAEAERDRSELAQLDLNLDAEARLVGDQLVNSATSLTRKGGRRCGGRWPLRSRREPANSGGGGAGRGPLIRVTGDGAVFGCCNCSTKRLKCRDFRTEDSLEDEAYSFARLGAHARGFGRLLSRGGFEHRSRRGGPGNGYRTTRRRRLWSDC